MISTISYTIAGIFQLQTGRDTPHYCDQLRAQLVVAVNNTLAQHPGVLTGVSLSTPQVDFIVIGTQQESQETIADHRWVVKDPARGYLKRLNCGHNADFTSNNELALRMPFRVVSHRSNSGRGG